MWDNGIGGMGKGASAAELRVYFCRLRAPWGSARFRGDLRQSVSISSLSAAPSCRPASNTRRFETTEMMDSGAGRRNCENGRVELEEDASNMMDLGA